MIGVIKIQKKAFETKSKIILNKELLIEGEYIYDTLTALKNEVYALKGEVKELEQRLEEKIKKDLRR